MSDDIGEGRFRFNEADKEDVLYKTALSHRQLFENHGHRELLTS